MSRVRASTEHGHLGLAGIYGAAAQALWKICLLIVEFFLSRPEDLHVSPAGPAGQASDGLEHRQQHLRLEATLRAADTRRPRCQHLQKCLR